jgi:4-hydroxy 2-oxovalerate aldolase
MENCSSKQVKIIDCTIRDGGLVNNFRFDDELVRNVYSTCNEAGIDYMEIGYKASEEFFSYEDFGRWKFCKEEEIRSVLGDLKDKTKISVMADIGRTNMKDILPKKESMIDMIRVAAYIEQVEEGLEMIKYISEKGYETSLNLMAVSKVTDEELNKALETIATSEVKVVCIVDSFGALHNDEIRNLTLKYAKYLGTEGKEIGIHAHNNRQMAYANTLEAIKAGASFVDATMAGLGRGAGNCLLELILGNLDSNKYQLRPVIKCIQDYILPLKKKIHWGYDTSYMLTGQYNLHPRSAISFIKEKEHKDKYVEFFDEVSEMNN